MSDAPILRAPFKKYEPAEYCPACGFDEHLLSACHGGDGDFYGPLCKGRGAHLHRECVACGAIVPRGTVKGEAVTISASRSERPILRARKRARR